MALSKFNKFFEASGKLGVGSVIFATVFLCVGILEHSKEKNITGFAFVLLAFVCLGCGCYLAWSTEYDKLQIELARNAKPVFSVEIEEAVHSAHNSHLVVKCAVTNLSEKMAGIRSASLLDRHSEHPRIIKADEQFKSAGMHDLGGNKSISVNGDEHGYVVNEKVGVKSISNLLKTASTLLPQAKREVGWLDFPGVLAIDRQEEGKTQFSITVYDTLGGEHGPVDITERVKGAMIL